MPLDPTNICACYYTHFLDCVDGCLQDPETHYRAAWRAAVDAGEYDEHADAALDREEAERCGLLPSTLDDLELFTG